MPTGARQLEELGEVDWVGPEYLLARFEETVTIQLHWRAMSMCSMGSVLLDLICFTRGPGTQSHPFVTTDLIIT